MGLETVNKLKNSEIHGDFVGRDKITNIIMFQESEREFVVTHNVNIKPVSYFTGRETELQELRQRIEEGRKSVLVSGMGGIGKTQICRKLFNEYNVKNGEKKNGPFSHIGYIEYNEDMGSSLMSCLSYKEQDNPELNQEAAWKELQHLASDGKLLLFVDNVDKTMREDQGLQRLNSIPGAIVLTSRQVSFSDEFEIYRIEFLDTEQCKEIYERIRYRGSGKSIKPEEHQDLEYIIDKLVGRHTMTVQFLANLASTKLWSVKRLREELEEKGFCLEFHKDGEIVNIQKAYEVLYGLSELTEAEKNILEAFSVFPYIPLSAEVCNQWLLKDAGASEEDDILTGLYRKGWLQFNIDQESYMMHPVFAQYICERNKPGVEMHHGMIEACQMSLKILENDLPLVCQKYVPYAKNIIKKMNMEKGREYEGIIDALAYLSLNVADYEQAQKWYEELLYICGDDYLKKATIYHNLAVVYLKKGQYESAEKFAQKSLQVRVRKLGENHADTVDSYCMLAGVFEKQSKYVEAIKLYTKSLNTYKLMYGDNHIKIAECYNNLAYVYKTLKKYAEAEEMFNKSIIIIKQVHGESNFNIAIVYDNLAQVYGNQGKYEEAEYYYNKSIKINKKAYGENHPEVAKNYHNLAGLYRNQKQYLNALDFFIKAYKIQSSRQEWDCRDTLVMYNSTKETYLEWNPEGNFKQWLEEKMKE